MYRRFCEAVDAVRENAAFIMQAERMALVKSFSDKDKAKNIRDLYGFSLHLDKKIIAFKRAFGDEPDAANLKLIIWNVMDPAQRLVAADTRHEASGKTIAKMGYAELVEHIDY